MWDQARGRRRAGVRKRFSFTSGIETDEADFAPGSAAFEALSAASRKFSVFLVGALSQNPQQSDLLCARDAAFPQRPSVKGDLEPMQRAIVISAAELYDAIAADPARVPALSQQFQATIADYFRAGGANRRLAPRAARVLHILGCL